MNILVIAGRVSSQPWTAGEVVQTVMAGLVERGHSVSLVAESIDDPGRCVRARQVCAMNRFEQSASDFPLCFGSWARRRARAIAHERSLSFSRVVPGADVWMPLDPTARSWLGDVFAARGVVRAAPTIAKHAGVLAELVTPSRMRGRAERVLAVGSVAAQGARRRARRGDVRELEFFAPAPSEPKNQARAEVRAALGIPRESVVIAAGLSGRFGSSLRGLFSEVALAHGPMSPIAGPTLVILTSEQYAAHTLALKSGADKFVRVVGLTVRQHELLEACDAVAVPTPCAGGAFEAGALGRLAATALSLGKPLIAAAGAPGAELCLRRAEDRSECGVVVDGSFGSWRRAIRMVADEHWRSKAAGAAREIGARLTTQRLLDDVIQALET